LPFAVAAAPIGKTVALRIVRQGRTLEIDATIKVMPMEDKVPTAPASKATLGMVLEELTPEAAQQYELSETSGLVITRIEEGSGAQEAGLEPGDVILEADQNPVTTLTAYERKMQAFSIGDTVLFLVSRSVASFFVTLKIE
jgi:serine protease Do